MDYQAIAKKIIELKNADLELRNQLIERGKLGNGYDEAMEKLHNNNAAILNDIIETIGYPTVEKVGEEASEAAWLVIQHAISLPEFMKKCARLLEKAVKEHQANPVNLAYLTDRIAAFQNQPQHYGTQFDWDAKGEMSPGAVDDWGKVNQRRKSIGLNTLEEQTRIMRQRVVEENQKPPADPEKRKQEYDAWRKKVGWIA